MRPLLVSVLLLAASPGLADVMTGTVLAFDRVAHVIVLDDKSIITVPNPDIIPEGLVAGDKIRVDYKSDGDNGMSKINVIDKM